ncbi:DUF1932 domain-containing protein [Streptomyces sp. E11-3]|uniref:DUF1932 domain-containing protein n=1 Tax=Streptomyces sp. E11-3 TaxID=3110112 RepID=UPI0039802985
MGTAVAAQARLRGAEVLWCPAGRSAASKERALRHGFTAVGDLGQMAARADIIFSICPPAHAEEVAAAVAAYPFSGVYVDANAVSPATMASISAIMLRTKATVVDGSIIGSPPSESKATRLYLSGPTEALTALPLLFTGSAVRVHSLPGGIGRASALKLSYSSYQKASRVLAAVAYALAADYGVEEELLDIAQSRTGSYLSETVYVPKVAARAWRWAPEMHEAASALTEAGLPTDLVEAAARVMQRWGDAKDRPLELREALELLHDPPEWP